jgi:predicted dehydrogenase
MGRHHARVYNELDQAELVAIADADPHRARTVGSQFKVPTYPTCEALLDAAQPEAVSIAVPTSLHYPLARLALERGIHVLVEKPFTSTIEEGRDLIARAERNGLCLAVGHVERFNSAVVELKRRLVHGELGEIFQIHAQRLSAFPQQIADVGVVMDLATHELDVMRYLLDAEVEYVFAETNRKVHARNEDMLSGILRFQNGAVGVLDINWLTPTKVRQLRINGALGMFVVDYLLQDLIFFENSYQDSQWDTLALLKGIEEGNMLKIRLSKVEPLRAELADFLDAVVQRRAPAVTGLDGIQAVRLAQALVTAGAEHRVVALAEPAESLPGSRVG